MSIPVYQQLFLITFYLFLLFNPILTNKISLKSKFLTDFITKHVLIKNSNTFIDFHLNCWNKTIVKSILNPKNTVKNVFYNLNSKNFNPNMTYKIYNIIDFDCSSDCDYEMNYFTSVLTNMKKCNNQGLILCDGQKFEQLVALLTNGDFITINSRIVIAKIGFGNYLDLVQIHRISKDYSIEFVKYGFWSENKLKIINIYKEIFNTRRNLQGLFFKVSYTVEKNESIPFLNEFRFINVDTLAKLNYGYFTCMIQALNITYEIIWRHSFGQFNKTTQKWDGTMDDFVNKRTNFSGSPLAITLSRLPHVDYLIEATQKLDIDFILKRPPISSVRDIFDIAFHKYVWYSLFATFLILTAGVALVLFIDTKYHQQPQRAPGDAFLVLLEAVCQQGTMTNVVSTSAEILFFVVFLSFLLFYTAYSVNIVTLLQSTTTVDSLEEFLESPFEAGAEDIHYMYFYMQNANDALRREFYETKVGKKGFYQVQEGLDKVMKGGFAFNIHSTPAYQYLMQHYDENAVCGLQILHANYLPTHLGYQSMPKHTPYKKIFKITSMRILEYGLHFRSINRFVTTPKCTGIAPSFQGIELNDVKRPFFIFLGGTFLSLCFLAFEFLHKNIKHRRGRLTKPQKGYV